VNSSYNNWNIPIKQWWRQGGWQGPRPLQGNVFSSPSLDNVYNFSSKITEILALLE